MGDAVLSCVGLDVDEWRMDGIIPVGNSVGMFVTNMVSAGGVDFAGLGAVEIDTCTDGSDRVGIGGVDACGVEAGGAPVVVG